MTENGNSGKPRWNKVVSAEWEYLPVIRGKSREHQHRQGS